MSIPMKSLPGTYALILYAAGEAHLTIGRLGRMEVRPGHYIYVGSAFGPGGVSARVGRHLRRSSRLHWHIDYLRQMAVVMEVWITYDPVRREHEWAGLLGQLPELSVPLPGFGASDCRCTTHLYFAGKRPLLDRFRRYLIREDQNPALARYRICH